MSGEKRGKGSFVLALALEMLNGAPSSPQPCSAAMAARRACAGRGYHAPEGLRAAVQPRCAQRLCAHVQILGGKLYVVAPPSQTA